MRLFIEGHNVLLGFVVSRCFSNNECSEVANNNLVNGLDVNHGTDNLLKPVRFFACRDKAKALISRYNRRFATH